jgi:hypothetical protein
MVTAVNDLPRDRDALIALLAQNAQHIAERDRQLALQEQQIETLQSRVAFGASTRLDHRSGCLRDRRGAHPSPETAITARLHPRVAPESTSGACEGGCATCFMNSSG